MAQVKEVVWTNPANGTTPVAIEIGFVPAKVTVIDVTTGNVFYWYDGMAQNSFVEVLAVGGDYPTYQTQGGYQWLGNVWLGGMPITAWTAPQSNGQQGQITVNNISWFNLPTNTTVKVVGAVCTPAANAVSINGTYTVALVNSNIITLNNPTTVPTYQNYIGGGFVLPVSTPAGEPYPQKIGCYGCILGASMVGTAGAQARALFESSVSVC